MQRQRYIAFTFLLMCTAGAVFFVRSLVSDHNNVRIEVSETDDELSLYASFPKRDSKRVQEYVKHELKLSDLSDMQHVDVKHYQTPDSRMRFRIKSRPGYIRIAMDRRENSERSYKQLRKTAEGVKKLLAGV